MMSKSVKLYHCSVTVFSKMEDVNFSSPHVWKKIAFCGVLGFSTLNGVWEWILLCKCLVLCPGGKLKPVQGERCVVLLGGYFLFFFMLGFSCCFRIFSQELIQKGDADSVDQTRRVL